MTSTQNPITSENYADLLIAYEGDLTVFNAYPNAPVHIINDLAAVVQIPVQNITNTSILDLGYVAVPTLFGLVSISKPEEPGNLTPYKLPNFNLSGKGVLVSIIDTGIDYTNPVFQTQDKTTRIVSIWDQTIENENPPEDRGFGMDFTSAQINQALQSENPFEVVPSKDENGHGTMIAGIAGGDEVPNNNFSGVAPEVEFVVVKLKQAKKVIRDYFLIPEGAVCYQETDILYGIEYCLKVSSKLNKPLVLCMSVNTSQSAHDGRGLVSTFLSLIAARSGMGVVVTAGDEGSSGRHYFGNVNPTMGYDTVELNIGENDKGFSMELWGESPSIFTIDITSPSGEYIPKINVFGDEHKEIRFSSEPTVINIDFRLVETQSGDQLILMRFSDASPGIWKINVYEKGDLTSGFHIWLPMTGFISDGTYFIKPDPYTTLLSFGNAELPISVTAYNEADDKLYINASKGYNRLGEIKPNIAAPGVKVTGPTIEHGFMDYTGTGVAVAQTAGEVALLLEWGIINNNFNNLSTVEINRIMMRTARREIGVVYPNRDWGFGILDMHNVFENLQI